MLKLQENCLVRLLYVIFGQPVFVDFIDHVHVHIVRAAYDYLLMEHIATINEKLASFSALHREMGTELCVKIHELCKFDHNYIEHIQKQ